MTGISTFFQPAIVLFFLFGSSVVLKVFFIVTATLARSWSQVINKGDYIFRLYSLRET